MSLAAEIAMEKVSKQEEVKERAAKIYRYVIRGMTATEIAKIEGLELRKAYWYIEEGGRILGGEIKLLTKRGVLKELFLHHRERTKELWFTYARTKLDMVKARCLEQLAAEDDRLLDLAERLKLIEQKSLKVDSDAGWVGLLSAVVNARSHGGRLNGRTGAGLAAPFSN